MQIIESVQMRDVDRATELLLALVGCGSQSGADLPEPTVVPEIVSYVMRRGEKDFAPWLTFDTVQLCRKRHP